MIDLKPIAKFQKPLAVLGLGVTGVAVARACKAAGIAFDTWDDSEEKRNAFKGEFSIKDFSKNLSDYCFIVPAPGIKPTHPVLKGAPVPIISDIDLLVRAAPQAKVIGITGTNGKSTTTALIGHILKAAGCKAEIGGNIGVAACDLPTLGADGIYVLELSSYQLAITADGVCDIAVILNITPDHLDWHVDFDDYVAAKKRILRPRKDRPSQIFIDGEKLSIDVPNWEKHEFLKGKHNLQNMQAAVAVCREVGLSDAEIFKHLFTFEGLPYRQKKIAQWKNVSFVNDSKATNADATSRALNSFDNIYWIAGGKPKSDGIDGLEKFYPKIRHVFLIGEAENDFARKLDGHLPYTKCGDMKHAVQAAFDAAKQNTNPNVVLLSPACASFDQYKNFEQRGDEFTALAQQVIA